MDNQEKNFYEAFASKDARFDGKFFVGVKSTGIYCRPVCRARLPKEENCSFYHTAAEAEKAGFRPCLICRPELAPELSSTNAKSTLAKKTARYIESNCSDGKSIEELAERLGYTDRHLRRVFAEEYNVSPIEYLQTCRLLLAKKLLTDTGLTVTEVAMASGFGSLRRFNDLFQKQYHLSPSGFRKQAKTNKYKSGTITVGLGYQPPYEWKRLISFLSFRAIPGVETVSDNAYSRTVCMESKCGRTAAGWLTVTDRPEKHMLSVTLSDGLLPVLPQVLSRVKNLFDLHCEPYAVSEKLADDPYLRSYVSGLRVPGCFEPFELCVRTILGQQISVKAASTLAGKMAKKLGHTVDTDVEGIEYTFPTVKEILKTEEPIEEELGVIGVIAARSKAIYTLAGMIEGKTIAFDYGADVESTKAALMSIPGIGSWTAAYIAMRALGDTDAFPETDLGIRKALGDKKPKEMRELSERWKPWRSYAAMSLWDSLHTEEKK